MPLHMHIQFVGVIAWMLAILSGLLSFITTSIALLVVGTAICIAGLMLDEEF